MSLKKPRLYDLISTEDIKVSVKNILYYMWFALIFWRIRFWSFCSAENGNIRLFLVGRGWGLEEAGGVCFLPYWRKKKCTFFQYEIITNETEENYLYELFICTTNDISQSSCLFMILQYYIFTGFGISWRRGDISLNITTSSYAKLPLWIYIKIDTLDRQIAKMKGEKKKEKHSVFHLVWIFS